MKDRQFIAIQILVGGFLFSLGCRQRNESVEKVATDELNRDSIVMLQQDDSIELPGDWYEYYLMEKEEAERIIGGELLRSLESDDIEKIFSTLGKLFMFSPEMATEYVERVYRNNPKRFSEGCEKHLSGSFLETCRLRYSEDAGLTGDIMNDGIDARLSAMSGFDKELLEIIAAEKPIDRGRHLKTYFDNALKLIGEDELITKFQDCDVATKRATASALVVSVGADKGIGLIEPIKDYATRNAAIEGLIAAYKAESVSPNNALETMEQRLGKGDVSDASFYWAISSINNGDIAGLSRLLTRIPAGERTGIVSSMIESLLQRSPERLDQPEFQHELGLVLATLPEKEESQLSNKIENLRK